MKLYFFGPVSTGRIIRSVIERDYISDGAGDFTTSQIQDSGLVKEVHSYRPAYQLYNNDVPVINDSTIVLSEALPTEITVGDELYVLVNGQFVKAGNIILIGVDSVVADAPFSVGPNEEVRIVGSVQPDDSYVITEDVNFYDESSPTKFSEDTEADS